MLKSVAGSATYVGDTTYDAAGRVDLRKLGSAASPVLQTDYIYYAWTDVNGLGRLQQLLTGIPSDSDSLQDLRYTYDPVGNVWTIKDYKAGGTQTQSFSYDALDRLLTAKAEGGSGGTYAQESHAYSPVGNLTGKAGTGHGYNDAAHPHAATHRGNTAATLIIRAKGSVALGIWPRMQLWLNRSLVQEWDVTETAYTDYNASVTLSGKDEIAVVFVNDGGATGEDRNLYVDYVVVDGRTVQAEDGAAVIDKGGGSAAFDGLNVIAGQQNIYWNAALRCVVGAQAYAACYDPNGNMTCRVRDGEAYLQSYDAENRLTQATHLPSNQTTTFTYDGDGGRVKEVGYENLAAGVNATSDATLNWPGVVTNGDTWADSGSGDSGEYAYTSQTGLHYVQLDLGAVYTVDKVKVWHYAADGRTYHATKTQVSENGSTWTTVFDSATAGEYQETAAGKTHTFTARNVRYVRDYLNGSTSNAGNHWVEIEVWGVRTTAYVGAHYERDGASGVAASTYYAGSTRVALRRGSVVYYLLSDHLGSTALSADSSGNEVSELRYRAWGETRYAGGSGMATDRRFTGQQQEAALGLYFYNARYYDGALGRFIQADTIVPEPGNPQSLNRYSYTYNNALRYIDPDGHGVKEWLEEKAKEATDWLLHKTGTVVDGVWDWTTDRMPDGSRKSTYQALGVAIDWFFETDDQTQVFGPDEPLTQDVRFDPAIDAFREAWAAEGYPLPWSWEHTVDKREGPWYQRVAGGTKDYCVETGQLIVSVLGFGSSSLEGQVDAVGGALGSFDLISVSSDPSAGNDMVKFQAYNTTGWASGTRIPGYGFGLIPNRDRSDWGPGGTIGQYFYWWEPMPQ